MENLAEKRRRVIDGLVRHEGLVVALSGGVDSALLAALAVEALGPARVILVTGRSASLPESDLADAARVAAELGAAHRIVVTRELERPEYRANRGDRCFHCRSELFETLRRVADEAGFPAVAYGAISDDLGDFRPGMQAAGRFGVLAPLLEAGIGKGEVRQLAAQLGLSVRSKPAAACLASRIPIGTEVTPERLERVARAEEQLRALGFGQFRVRDHGEVARLELDGDEIARLADGDLRDRLARSIEAAGFRFVTVDLRGYCSGSLNPVGEGPGDPA